MPADRFSSSASVLAHRQLYGHSTEDYIVEMKDVDVRYVVGDEERISQILVNLLSNASKFTEKGEIRVTFRQMMRKKDSVEFLFRVHDTGKGMDPKFIKRIFHPFEQENAVSILELSGASVDVAVNGRDAVEKFAAAPPGTYDFILMDIQMPEGGNIETDLKNASNLLVSPETSDMPSVGNLPQGVGKSAAVIAGTSNNSSDQSVIKLPSGSGKVLKYILADHSGFFTAAEGLEVVRENATADCKELYQLLLGKNLKELEPYSLTAPNLTSVFISAVNPPKIDGNTFGDIQEALDGGLHVIVPEESLALYQDAWREVPDSEVIDQLKTAVNILWGILLVVLLFKGIGIVLLEFRHLITERRLLGILETAARRKRGSPGSFWITSRDFTPV